jgi:CHAT domain-containing protein
MWTPRKRARQAVRELEAEMRLPVDTPARRGDRELADALNQARTYLDRLIERIRSEQPEFIPTGLDLPGLLGLIPDRGALVAPLFTAKGSAVFVLPHGTTAVSREHVIELNQFTTAELQTLLRGADDEPELSGWLGAYAKQDSDPKGWLAAIETTGRNLWEGLIGAVHERLAGLGLAPAAPVLLMPQGGLGLLPLHAAWREVDGQRRCFLDDWSVIYAPSGYAVSISWERLKETRRQGQALLAVVNPTQDLVFTPVEAKAVMALFADVTPLTESDATVAAVMKATPGRQYLHVCGHGFYHWQDAMQSGLVMAERKTLTLAAIISDLDLSTCRLVTLSACETGITDVHQSPDEFLGLPAGLLQAGAPAVVSTLWPVNDLSTMLLMGRFYQGHVGGGLALASALRAAQLWLRDATAGELNLSDRWRQVYQTASDRELAKAAFKNMRYFKNHPNDRPFASPHHWAGFVFAGE